MAAGAHICLIFASGSSHKLLYWDGGSNQSPMPLGNPQSCQLPTITKYIVPRQNEGSATMKIEKLRAVWSTKVSCLIAEITPIGKAMTSEKMSASPASSSVTGALSANSAPTD